MHAVTIPTIDIILKKYLEVRYFTLLIQRFHRGLPNLYINSFPTDCMCSKWTRLEI